MQLGVWALYVALSSLTFSLRQRIRPFTANKARPVPFYTVIGPFYPVLPPPVGEFGDGLRQLRFRILRDLPHFLWHSAPPTLEPPCIKNSLWTYTYVRVCTIERAFSFAGPVTWNSLPAELCSIIRQYCFKNKRKTYLFNMAFNVQ